MERVSSLSERKQKLLNALVKGETKAKMNLAWNTDGVSISGITTSQFVSTSLVVSGTGRIHREKSDIPFEWQANIGAIGWEVTIIGVLGRTGSYQGSTYNLPLEVAAAAKRLL